MTFVIPSSKLISEADFDKALLQVAKNNPIYWPIICLPFLFNFNGKPLSLSKHFYTEPFYRLQGIPATTTYMTGRQVGKSLALSVQSHLRSWSKDFWHLLIFTPLFSQVSYLSDTYFGPLVKQSPRFKQFVDQYCKQNNLYRSFTNGSSQIYSYAFNNADRIRGKSVDAVTGDEMQDFNYEFLPVIEECMSAREHVGVRQFTGTPKTLDNTLTHLFESGSQAEWHIKCPGCGKENIPKLGYDILNMIGKEGVICAKCGKLLDPSTGGWVHHQPEKRITHCSYHVPQIICPIHYGIREKWDKLVYKMHHQEKHLFYNEVLGQPCDTGQKLVSLSHLQQAAVINASNHIEDAKALCQSGRYTAIALGVDWSGGGKEYQSYTGVALVGALPNGTLEVPFMKTLPYTTDHMEEATLVMSLAQHFGAQIIAHDFSGAGNVRETCLVHSGWPLDKVMPMTLTSMKGDQGMLKYHDPGDNNVRDSWSLDKGRSLVFLCSLIKSGGVHFPKYESCEDELKHFLNLVEHYVERPTGGPTFGVTKVPGLPDDMAHAVNFGAMCIFNMLDYWPNIAQQYINKFNSEEDPDRATLSAQGYIEKFYGETKL